MSCLYERKDSPYIWLKFYDKKEKDPKKKRKSFSTKFTKDRVGWRAAQDFQKKFDLGKLERDVMHQYGIKIKKQILFSQGKDHYFSYKPSLAHASIDAYNLSGKHLMNACSDKYIDTYTNEDYLKLLEYFKKKDYSPHSQAIHMRHLSALWKFFVSKEYATENIIIKLKAPQAKVRAIPFALMQRILKYYREKQILPQYHLVYFLLLTGMRISSALAQTWERINFEDEIILVRNVKAKKDFYFPIYPELKDLLIEMGVQKKGRLFPEFAEGFPPKFFSRDMETNYNRGWIDEKYTIHHLRKTFTSWLVNAGVDQAILQKLLDHSDIRITDQNYTLIETRLLKAQFKKLKFFKSVTKSVT